MAIHRRDHALSEPAPPTPSETRRRRWVSVGEIVGVLALLVAGVSFWDSHEERARLDRDRAEAERRAAAQAIFLMRGEVEADGQRLRLEPVRADQVIQSQVFVFPAKVRAGEVRTTGAARIEAAWFADGARKAPRPGGKDEVGDLRMPVGVTTTFMSDGQAVTDQSIYLIGYTLKPRLLLGARIELQGLSLARRGAAGDLRAKVEAMWP
jgi:hypothetical protein